MPALTNAQASRRYAVEFTIVVVAYCVFVFAAPALIEATHATGNARAALALAPAVPVAGIFIAMDRYLAAADEFVRKRLVTAMLVAAAFVFSAATAWDFLRVYAGAEPIPPFSIAPGFFAAMGLAQGLLRAADAIREARGA